MSGWFPLPPRLEPTTFPDAEVAAAINEFERTASRLDTAACERTRATDPALETWDGPCARVTGADHRAGQRGAQALAADFRAAAQRLRQAQDQADGLRRRRQAAHDEAMLEWIRALEEAS